MRKFRLSLVMMVDLLLVPALWAGLIYDNGAPNGVFGNEMTAYIQAEDFTLAAPTTLTGVRFWAFDLSPVSYAGSIAWRIYADNSGEPGAVIASDVVVPTRVWDHDSWFTSYQHDFTLAVALGAGTYWLGLHNGDLTLTDGWYYWETAGLNATLTGHEDNLFDTDGWYDNGQEHAFQLYGGVVPEPSTWLLLGAGFIWLAALARRRRT